MKTKKYIIIAVVVLLVVIGMIAIFKSINKPYRKELDNKEKTILAEKSYSNSAWGFTYNGMAIFNDGTIYEWDFRGENGDYKANNSKEHANWILENGSKIDKKVSKKELDEIEKNITNLEDNIELESNAYDAGSNSVSVWNKDNEKIVLKESGDYRGENKSENSKKLIKIINKYLD